MKSYVLVKISDKNSKRVLNEILNLKINVIKIKYLKDDIFIKLSYNDYLRIKSIRSVNSFKIIKYMGKKRILEDLVKYKISVISLILGILLVIFLSLHIFYIKIDTNNDKLKKEVMEKLRENNITNFSLKKSFNDLKQIKSKIKNNNQNIDWIELKYDGVVLNIKIIEKKEKYNNIDFNKAPSDIIAKKSGYIRKINATSGDVLKNPGDYVNRGEIIITGNIIKNDEIVNRTTSKGMVYAEVWTIKKLSMNLNYNSREKTGYFRKKTILIIGNKVFTLSNIRAKKSKPGERIIFKNNLFTLKSKTEEEYINKDKKYNEKEAISTLLSKGKKSILKGLDKTEYISSQKTLKKYKENDKITIEVLFKTYEEIGMRVKSKEFIEKEE